VRRLSFAIAITLIATSARADEPEGKIYEPPIGEIRALFAKGDYEGARKKVLEAYAIVPRPELLFVLGQVEFNLRHWQAAIDAYEKFIASEPPEDQVALAQQAIGAARIEMQRAAERPPPPPPPKPRRREWFTSDTIIVASGGGAVALGAALFVYGRHLGNDRAGSLSDYDRRTDRAQITQWTGGGLAIAGVVAAGVAVVRWRLRPDDGEVVVTPTSATVSFAW
jgi:tetratricopeptide (TPR) repeat protein